MPIEIRGISPLLEVFDMPASIAFYCDLRFARQKEIRFDPRMLAALSGQTQPRVILRDV